MTLPAARLLGVRPCPRSWVLAGTLAVAVLFPARSLEQLIVAASLLVALGVMAAWGVLVVVPLLAPSTSRDVRPELGFFTTILLGELILLLALELLSPLVAAVSAATRVEMGLLPVVWLSTTVLLVLARRRVLTALCAWRATLSKLGTGLIDAPVPWLHTVTGLAALFVAAGIASRHWAAWGLDTHEHMGWALHVYDLGYVPLAERHTNILSDYPKLFHLLAAEWSAAGLGMPIGPTVKLMPFLQSALPCLALSEALLANAGRHAPGSREHTIMTWLLSGLFVIYAFLVVPMVYPWPDLSGTPRFASNAILSLPFILLLLDYFGLARRGRLAALVALPIVAAWALLINPVVLLALLFIALPFFLVCLVCLRRPHDAEPTREPIGWRSLASGWAVCTTLALLAIGQDPWVLSQLAPHASVVDSALHTVGIETLEEAVRTGEATPREKWSSPARPPICESPSCYLDKLETALFRAVLRKLEIQVRLGDDLSRLTETGNERWSAVALRELLPFERVNVQRHAALYLAPTVLLGSALAGLRLLRARRRRSAPAASQTEGALPLLVLTVAAAFYVGDFGQSVMAEMAVAINDTPMRNILAGYAGMVGAHVGMAYYWYWFAPAALLVALRPASALAAWIEARRVPLGLATRLGCGSPALFFLAAWLALPFAAKNTLREPLNNPGFWSPVGLGDLLSLRELETLVPAQDSVLVAAVHWTVNGEHWVMPGGEATALLPYARSKYVFNVFNGYSIHTGWRDLDRVFCGHDEGARQSFFAHHRTRWFLLRKKSDETSDEAYTDLRLCARHLSDFGIERTPTAQAGNILLYKLDVPDSAHTDL